MTKSECNKCGYTKLCLSFGTDAECPIPTDIERFIVQQFGAKLESVQTITKNT